MIIKVSIARNIKYGQSATYYEEQEHFPREHICHEGAKGTESFFPGLLLQGIIKVPPSSAKAPEKAWRLEFTYPR